MRLHHALWASGPLLAELSAGSILGSLLLGGRASAARPPQRLARLLTTFALGLAALTAAALTAAALAPPLLAIVTPLAGLSLGPTLATLFTLGLAVVAGVAGMAALTATLARVRSGLACA